MSINRYAYVVMESQSIKKGKKYIGYKIQIQTSDN